MLQRYQIIFGTRRERIRSLNALVSNAAKDCSLRWHAAVLSKPCSEVKNSYPSPPLPCVEDVFICQ